MKGITNEMIGAASYSMILAVLREGDSYGYEIIHKMKEITEGKLNWQEASIYPFLKKLEKDEFITSYWKYNIGDKPRRYYSIKEKGVEKLYESKKEWYKTQEVLKSFWNFE